MTLTKVFKKTPTVIIKKQQKHQKHTKNSNRNLKKLAVFTKGVSVLADAQHHLHQMLNPHNPNNSQQILSGKYTIIKYQIKWFPILFEILKSSRLS